MSTSSSLVLAALVLPLAGLAADRPADFQTTQYLNPGQTLEIRLIDGSIQVEPSNGPLVEVSAWKTGSRPDPATLSIEPVQHESGLLICVVYPSPRPDSPNRCTLDGAQNNVVLYNPDLKVNFVVRIPSGIAFRASVVNGTVSTAGASPLDVKVVNGSITAGLGKLSGMNALSVVNGTITATLAPSASAVVHAEVVLGKIESEFPLTFHHSLVGSTADGVIGNGEGNLRLNVVNGKITLERDEETGREIKTGRRTPRAPF